MFTPWLSAFPLLLWSSDSTLIRLISWHIELCTPSFWGSEWPRLVALHDPLRMACPEEFAQPSRFRPLSNKWCSPAVLHFSVSQIYSFHLTGLCSFVRVTHRAFTSSVPCIVPALSLLLLGRSCPICQLNTVTIIAPALTMVCVSVRSSASSFSISTLLTHRRRTT